MESQESQSRRCDSGMHRREMKEERGRTDAYVAGFKDETANKDRCHLNQKEERNRGL